ncbi:MAG: hypothetical protein ACP5QO_01275 [Clostridia bacterium]
MEFARAFVTRAISGGRERRAPALTLALVPLSRDTNIARLVSGLRQELGEDRTLHLTVRGLDDSIASGASAAGPGDDLDGMVGAWLSEQETRHRFILYATDPEASPWTVRCLRQADRVVLVATAGTDSGPGPSRPPCPLGRRRIWCSCTPSAPGARRVPQPGSRCGRC